MVVICSSVKRQRARVYSDDVVVSSKMTAKYVEHVRSVLRLLQDVGVTRKLKKCGFFTSYINYLRHVISPTRPEIASYIPDAKRDKEPPTKVTECKLFL